MKDSGQDRTSQPEQDPDCSRILQAARRLFFARGLRAVTMDDIAAATGMSKKTVYNHFESKEQLVRFFAGRLIETLTGVVAKIFEEESNPLIALEKASATMTGQFAGVSPAYYEDLQKYYPEVWGDVDRARGENLGLIKGHLARAQERGLVKEGIDLEVAVAMYQASVRAVLQPGFLMSHPVSFNRAVNTLVEIFLRGVSREPGS